MTPLEDGSAAPPPATDARLSVVVVTPKGFLGGAERWLLSLLDHADRIAPWSSCSPTARCATG